MFVKFFEKVNTFKDHHQAFIGLIIAIGVVCFSWGLERILEEYIFPKKPFYGYIISIFIGLTFLWLTKHVILNVI